MCLGIPGQILERWDEGGAPMARVDFAGDERKVCLAYLPYLAVGDFLIAHMGYALTKVDAETAQATTELMRAYGVLPPVAEKPGSAA